MKKILILTTLVTILVILCFQSIKPAQSPIPKTLPLNQDQIRDATLIIVVELIQRSGVTLGYGMGTLVQHQGESYLVTHNHYGDLLEDMNLLELRDANHKLIRSIYGKEFKSLIVYQDAGTLVLRLPDRLADALTPANVEAGPQLKQGDIVQVAHLAQPDRDQVEILEAVIVEVGVSDEEPVYLLRSLSGETLNPGDSGGGVWHAGKFVANTWAVLNNSSAVGASGSLDPQSMIQTNMSYAAIFPQDFKQLVLPVLP